MGHKPARLRSAVPVSKLDDMRRVRITGAEVLAVLALLSACSSGSDGAHGGSEAVPVTTAPVVRRDIPVEIQAIGSVTPFATVEVKSQVVGQLAEIRFREGQDVGKGDLLFVIDTEPFEAALREAEAKLARDRAEAANARTEAGRIERLSKDGIVSRDQYDQAMTRATMSGAVVEADLAAVEIANIQLRHCRIHSPLSGRIGEILVHAGNVVEENETTLAVINQIRPVQVEFSVPEADLPSIRSALAGGTLPVAVGVPGNAVGRPPLLGDLMFVDNAVNTTTGTVLLKATFANQAEELWPGQFVNVTIQLATQSGALLVPARAIQTGQQGRYVYTMTSDHTVELRPVEVGITVGEDIVVTQGLDLGEAVVADGALRLAPGMRVEPKAATEPANGAAPRTVADPGEGRKRPS